MKEFDEFEVYEPRRISSTTEGYRIRVGKTRITYALNMAKEMGDPDRVDIMRKATVFAIRGQPDEDQGMKVQKDSKTTRSIAAKGVINEFDIPKGIFSAELIGGVITWVAKDEE